MKAKATGAAEGGPGGGQETAVAGAVVAGVAHDVNNLLTIMLAYAALVFEGLEPDDPLRAEVEEIQAAGERASRLTRQLLALGCGQPTSPRLADLNQVTRGMERMLRHALGKERGLTVVPAPDLDKVLVDPGQIERVLLNLVVNARDAMPAGGQVTIETAKPLFTTKEQGTGLGLAVVSSFVKRSGGHVRVHSEPGKGTRFEVYLPRAEDAA
jgi:two-component system, cell cycle sensor histidine kinase and response regulator CckA